jgi:hypothetical protein
LAKIHGHLRALGQRPLSTISNESPVDLPKALLSGS